MRFGFRAMGSPCELRFWGASRAALRPLVEACMQEVFRLERKYSRYREDSLASRINRSAGDPPFRQQKQLMLVLTLVVLVVLVV